MGGTTGLSAFCGKQAAGNIATHREPLDIRVIMDLESELFFAPIDLPYDDADDGDGDDADQKV